MALAPTIGLTLHFRHQAHTKACLESLLVDGVNHVVLVDNSEDNGASLSLLQPALVDLAAQGMVVAVCEPGRNLGFSAGVNYGLTEVNKRFGAVCVLLINNDARLRPGAHLALRNAIEQGAENAVPAIHSLSGHTTASAFYHRLTGLLLREFQPGAYEHFSGCCMLLSPGLASAPLFDEDFFFYGDDAELGWRLLQLGVRQTKVPTAIVEHDASTGSRNGSLFYEYHMNRAHWILAGKVSTQRFEHMLFVIIRVFTLTARALLRTGRQRSLLPLKGLSMATADFIRGRCRTLTPTAPAPAAPGADSPSTPAPRQSP